MNRLLPDIPKVEFPNAPSDDLNTVKYWGFYSIEEIEKNQHSLLMMDLDFGRKCSLKCPSCFRKKNPVDDKFYSDLSYDQLMDVLKDAKHIGLKEVKLCGAGEPLEDSRLLQLAEDLTELDIGLSIFTKAHVLGDDNHVKQVYGKFGVTTAFSLCQRFFDLKTSFLVSFQSLKPDIQDELVGGIKCYSEKRNRGIELLANAGFNKSTPTRLAICANPMMSLNFEELFDIYVYARERNILPVNAALMVSGKQIDSNFLSIHDVSYKKKEEFFLRVYRYNLSHGIQSQNQLLNEGISCLPGIHPCNQIAVGVYLTCNGNVLRCPGDKDKPVGNVHEQNIREIWDNQNLKRFAGVFNCKCPFKDCVTLPDGIYNRVLDRLLNVNFN